MRKQEEQYGRFPTSWVKGTSTLPKAPFTLTKDQISIADRRAMSVHVPYGFDWRPHAIFGNPGGMKMKSHEWKQVVTSGVLKFCLRNSIASKQQHTMFNLFDIIRELCAECVDSSRLEELKSSVQEALALVERAFPMSLQVIVFHLLQHLPFFVGCYGPIYGFWMYPYERFNSWIARRVTSRRHPESTVVETYRLCEWAHFMEIAGHLPIGATSTCSVVEDNVLLHPQSDSSVLELTDEVVCQLQTYYAENKGDETKVLAEIAQYAVRKKHLTYFDHHNRKVKLSATELQIFLCRNN